ncbi:hypothetical protein CLIB1444_08S00408 [[Candida] jaroonii]|uniref:Uncharacterized protein n=1 Tax=[Candida] jaroonii TaxID=467808 RepID=A0ACA9YB69_9ASCO|nr:hypothetical protein CLIB1444_08S00408 [[Candida] jaroonii]
MTELDFSPNHTLHIMQTEDPNGSEIFNEEESNKYSCNECRRRRVKCSRHIPTCNTCSKYKRHCLYERHMKTPLTRKHLTEVEEELALLKSVLCKVSPDLDIDDLKTRIRNGDDSDEIIDQVVAEKLPKKRRIDEFRSISIPQILDESSPKEDRQIVQLLPPSVNLETTLKVTGVRSKPKTIEVSPQSQDSYNWDERKQGDLGQPSIINGMATTESNSYLGAASSAALLNIVGGGFFLHEKPRDKVETSGVTTSSASREITEAKLEQYINQYFELYHVSYPIVHKHLFLAQFNQIIPTPSNWESLLYIVAAIGSFMSATDPNDNDDLSLFEKSKAKLSIDDLETGNLTLVQTLTLMSNYLQKRDRPNSGYNYLGLAVRMALGLGLHKDIDDTNESLLNQESKRRVWWCLYIFDCGATITYGRPLGIPSAGIDAKLPLNILDTKLTPKVNDLPFEENEPTIYTSLRLQSLFHIFSNSIYERIISDPFPSTEQLLKWDQEYLKRSECLIPEYFREDQIVHHPFKLSHLILHWRYKNLRIIMYRTIVIKQVILNSKNTFSDDYETQAREICLESCNSTINSMFNFWSLNTHPNRMEAWYSLYFLIPAVMMPLICLRNDPNSMNSNIWRANINSSKQIIQKIMNICPPAERILNMIESLGADYLSYQDLNFNSTDESPSSQLLHLHHLLWPGSFDIEQQFSL